MWRASQLHAPVVHKARAHMQKRYFYDSTCESTWPAILSQLWTVEMLYVIILSKYAWPWKANSWFRIQAVKLVVIAGKRRTSIPYCKLKIVMVLGGKLGHGTVFLANQVSKVFYGSYSKNVSWWIQKRGWSPNRPNTNNQTFCTPSHAWTISKTLHDSWCMLPFCLADTGTYGSRTWWCSRKGQTSKNPLASPTKCRLQLVQSHRLNNQSRKTDHPSPRTFHQRCSQQHEGCQHPRRCDDCQPGQSVAWPVLNLWIPTNGCSPLARSVQRSCPPFPFATSWW